MSATDQAVPEVTRVFGLALNRPGPWRACQPAPDEVLSWCGVEQQFRHVEAPGTATDVTCAKCLTALRQNQPRAWQKR